MLDKHDKNFLINMSPFLITAVIMFILMVAFELKAQDNVDVVYTGIEEGEIQVRSINTNTIRSWDWIEETEILRLTLNRKRQVDIKFFNKCFDMPYASALQFKTWANSSFISKGDGILPVGFTNERALYPCTIKSMTEVIEEKEDGEEN